MIVGWSWLIVVGWLVGWLVRIVDHRVYTTHPPPFGVFVSECGVEGATVSHAVLVAMI